MSILKTFFTIVTFICILNLCGLLLFGGTLSIPPDTQSYYSPAAISIVEGRGYSVGGNFVSSYPPLFSLFLALVYWITGQAGTHNSFYPFFEIILQSLSCGFLYLITRTIFNARVAIVSAFVLALYPFFLVLSVSKYAWNAMPLFTFIFYLALVFFVTACRQNRRLNFFLSGIFLGLSSLAWPGSVYLWAPLALFAAFSPFNQNKKMHRTIFFLLIILGFWLPVAAWSIVIHNQTGRDIVISDKQMYHLRGGLVSHPDSALANEEVVRDATKEFNEGRLTTTLQISAFYRNEFLKKPKAVFRFILNKMLRSFYSTESEKYDSAIFLLQSPYFALGIYGFIVSIRKKIIHFYFLALIVTVIFYFWFVAVSGLSILRYTMPALGLFMAFVSAGLNDILEKMFRPNARGITNSFSQSPLH